jgi:hypothetical protein
VRAISGALGKERARLRGLAAKPTGGLELELLVSTKTGEPVAYFVEYAPHYTSRLGFIELRPSYKKTGNRSRC